MKTKIIQNPYLLTIVSGVLLILCFPPFNLHFLIWIALVPFLYLMYTTKFEQKKFLIVAYHQASIYGLLLGAIFCYGTLYWFFNVFGLVGGIILLILPIVFMFYSLILNYILVKISNPYIQFFLPAILWTAVELFRSECWRFKFSWMSLGYSQHNFLPILQSASIVGVYGISFVIVLVNTIVFYILFKTKNLKQKLLGLVGIVAIFVITIGFGVLKLRNTYNPNIKVALVQNESSYFEDNLDLSNNINEEVDIIVWPEYSVPYNLFDFPDHLSGIQFLNQSKSSYLILGSQDPAEFDKKSGFFNTAFVFDPMGKLIGKYVKMNPIQFFQDGVAGKDYTVFDTKFGKIGTAICYDMDYSYVSRNIVKNGAEILFIPTFDKMSWGKIQHQEHSAMTSMRAVENGVFVARAATSGVSQIVDPEGRITYSLDIAKQGVLIGKLAAIQNKTFFTLYGYLFAYICMGFVLIVLLYTLYIDKLKKKFNSLQKNNNV